MKVKAISADIFKSKSGDCSNGGLSSKFNEVLVICEDGYIEVDLDNPPENLCEIVHRTLWGENADYIKPYKDKPAGTVGYMYGGTIVYACDSRFPDKPLMLHDRCETQEHYDMMSH